MSSILPSVLKVKPLPADFSPHVLVLPRLQGESPFFPHGIGIERFFIARREGLASDAGAFGRVFGNCVATSDFGANNVMVKGHCKVTLHLMFGVITLFADQLLRLIG